MGRLSTRREKKEFILTAHPQSFKQYEDPAASLREPLLQLVISMTFSFNRARAVLSSLLTMAEDFSFTSFHNIVAGKQRGSEKTTHTVDPATLENLWEIPIATELDVEDAVTAAKNAFRTWKKTPFEERVELLKVWGDACRPYLKQFGEVIVKENGKPVCSNVPARSTLR
jgi:delta 1-pyrroline-5-carboxylate dehydrogenase